MSTGRAPAFFIKEALIFGMARVLDVHRPAAGKRLTGAP